MQRSFGRQILLLALLLVLAGPAPLALECTPEKPACCCPGGCGNAGSSDGPSGPCCDDAEPAPVPETVSVEVPTPTFDAAPIGTVAALSPNPAPGFGLSEPPGPDPPPVPLFTLHAAFLI